MKVTVIDYESFYDQEYSLRKMTPAEYILDPRFEAIGCAVKEPDTPTYWVDGPDLQKYFDQADPSGMYVSHNWLFDGCITAWRYNFIPRYMACTLSISRAVLGHVLKNLSLKEVARYLGLPPKGDTVHKVQGMNLEAIKFAGLYDEYTQYSIGDADLCEGIFTKLVRTGIFPASELNTLDMVLRCAIQPRFKLDLAVLAEHKNAIRLQKDTLLAQAMLSGADTKASLMSNDKFAVLLQNVGVEPPMKISLATGLPTYAFSKTDPEFIALQEHENPAVQALVAARLGHKSTLEETRTERLISIAGLSWPDEGQAQYVPIPLRYSAAHTHRLGGDWKLNMQNLPTRGESNALRRALIAGPGEEVGVTDASQIEARITAWLCGQQDLVDDFAAGVDIYSAFASDVFGYPINRKSGDPDHVAKGFVGKTGVLQLGFGSGWEKFQKTVKILSKQQTGTAIELTDQQAQQTVNTYRRRYHFIPQTWRLLDHVGIPVLAGSGGTFELGPCTFEKGAINLPNGLQLKYHNLRHSGARGWVYDYGGETKHIYGAKLLENIVQALARIVTMDAAVRIQKRIAPLGLWLNLQAHDELAYLYPVELRETVVTLLAEEMRRRPTWAPDLPLNCEVNTGSSYGAAK